MFNPEDLAPDNRHDTDSDDDVKRLEELCKTITELFHISDARVKMFFVRDGSDAMLQDGWYVTLMVNNRMGSYFQMGETAQVALNRGALLVAKAMQTPPMFLNKDMFIHLLVSVAPSHSGIDDLLNSL